jgi:hypothetical protein
MHNCGCFHKDSRRPESVPDKESRRILHFSADFARVFNILLPLCFGRLARVWKYSLQNRIISLLNFKS